MLSTIFLCHMASIIFWAKIKNSFSKSLSDMASLEARFHLIKQSLLVSVEVDRKISSSYEHVDHFQLFLNK